MLKCGSLTEQHKINLTDYCLSNLLSKSFSDVTLTVNIWRRKSGSVAWGMDK